MLKIILKSIILVCIILSIYFIVNPSACSNLINGRVVNSREEMPGLTTDDAHEELFTPTGDQPLRPADKPAKISAVDELVAPSGNSSKTVVGTQQAQPASTQTGTTSRTTSVAGISDTNSLQPQPTQLQQRSQTERDYAIASRYVELENQYLAQHKDSKNAAKDIAYIVMDDFKLTPLEWEDFLRRATASNLFEQIRQQQKK